MFCCLDVVVFVHSPGNWTWNLYLNVNKPEYKFRKNWDKHSGFIEAIAIKRWCCNIEHLNNLRSHTVIFKHREIVQPRKEITAWSESVTLTIFFPVLSFRYIWQQIVCQANKTLTRFAFVVRKYTIFCYEWETFSA